MTTVKRAVHYRLGCKRLFEIVRHHINYYIHSIVTFPICIVTAVAVAAAVTVVTGMNGLIDMTDSDFDCNYTDKNQRACFSSHLNPLYMHIAPAHSLRNSHFVIKSKQEIFPN